VKRGGRRWLLLYLPMIPEGPCSRCSGALRGASGAIPPVVCLGSAASLAPNLEGPASTTAKARGLIVPADAQGSRRPRRAPSTLPPPKVIDYTPTGWTKRSPARSTKTPHNRLGLIGPELAARSGLKKPVISSPASEPLARNSSSTPHRWPCESGSNRTSRFPLRAVHIGARTRGKAEGRGKRDTSARANAGSLLAAIDGKQHLSGQGGRRDVSRVGTSWAGGGRPQLYSLRRKLIAGSHTVNVRKARPFPSGRRHMVAPRSHPPEFSIDVNRAGRRTRALKKRNRRLLKKRPICRSLAARLFLAANRSTKNNRPPGWTAGGALGKPVIDKLLADRGPAWPMVAILPRAAGVEELPTKLG